MDDVESRPLGGARVKQLNLNVVGDSGRDVPVLVGDDGTRQAGTIYGSRAVFVLLDKASGGATISYAAQTRTLRIIIPPTAGSYEADLPPVKPPEATAAIVLDYRTAAPTLAIAGDGFVANGSRWLLKGVTEFRLLELFQSNRTQFDAVLDQRIAAGANTFRVLCMKANNTGWALTPVEPHALADCQAALDARGVYGLFCVFADTRALMPDAQTQQRYWADTIQAIRAPHLVQCCNEWNHPTQAINPNAFAKPTAVLACHGSGQTDCDPVSPRWDFACYSARRDALPDARGISNYSSYEFQARYPQPGPLIPVEGLKPTDYACDVSVARLMGAHAALNAGGVFHGDDGVNGRLWAPEVDACARVFFEAIR